MTICDFDDFVIVETHKGHAGKGGRPTKCLHYVQKHFACVTAATIRPILQNMKGAACVTEPTENYHPLSFL